MICLPKRRSARRRPSTRRRWGSPSAAIGFASCRYRAATGQRTSCRSPPGRRALPILSGCWPIRTIVKLFHYGRFDMAVLHHAFGVMAAPVYCTKIASKIARTYTDRHGLKDLTRELIERRDLQAAAIVRLGGRHPERGAARLCRIGRAASARLAREAGRHAETRGPGRTRARRLRLSPGSRPPRPCGIRGHGRFFARLSLNVASLARPVTPSQALGATAAFCIATSSRMPPRANASIRMSSSSVNGAPSADP